MPTFRAIILDVETTTNKATPERPLEVVELAWVPLPFEDGFVTRYKPSMPCTFGATAVHHILPEDLEGCPPSSEAPNDLPNAEHWIGHNIDFDWRALGSPPVKRICTLALSRSLWPELDSHTLSAMTYFLNGRTAETRDRLRNAHSATADCRFAFEIFTAACAKLGTRDLDAMYAHSEEARIPKLMTIGKFAGKPISAVDRGWASWYSRTDEPDPYLIAALKRQGLLR